MSMINTVGHIEPFNDTNDDWKYYVERFELFVQCNNIVAKKMLASSNAINRKSIMGKKAFKIVNDLSIPDKPESRTYEKIKECNGNYYRPKSYFITECVKFNNRVQRDEIVQDYIKEVKKLSVDCKFAEWLVEWLRDRLVSGLNIVVKLNGE